MPTIKVFLKTAYQSKDNSYPIVIEVRHNGRKKHINVDAKILEKSWTGSEVKDSHPEADIINSKIQTELARIRKIIADCSLNSRPFLLDMLEPESSRSRGFAEYLRKRAEQYYQKGQIIMRRKLKRFAFEIEQCFGRDVHFNEWSKDKVQQLDTYLIKLPNKANTRLKKFSFYHQFYIEAVEQGMAPLPSPFKKPGIMAEPVKKEKLSEKELKALAEVELSNINVQMARDLFMLSYYCKGARFENVLTMKRFQIGNGRIYFQTNKGKKHLSVLIHPKLQALIDKYPHSDFIIPLIDHIPEGKEAYIKMVDSHNTKVNKWLKRACKAAGIKTVTMHEARHTFAYLLKTKTDNIHVIKDSLGHSTTKQTEAYLKSLDDEILDKEVSKLYE
jgi:integrase/recombinase XerD